LIQTLTAIDLQQSMLVSKNVNTKFESKSQLNDVCPISTMCWYQRT